MRKEKKKSKYSKIDKYYERMLWISGFILVFVIGQLAFFLLLGIIPLILLYMFLVGVVILEFYTDYSTIKWFRPNPNLKKKVLKFEKDLIIQSNKLMENIKIVEGKVRRLEDMYTLLEKDELLNIKFKRQKEKHQLQNYKFKLDNLKDSLHEIKMNYDESIKPELKILWTTKPGKLNRKLKHLSGNVKNLNTQCNRIKLKLKEKLKKK